MSDEIDIATANWEVVMAARIAADSVVPPPKYPPVGKCYNCLEPIAEALSFCDGDCRADLMKRERRK